MRSGLVLAVADFADAAVDFERPALAVGAEAGPPTEPLIALLEVEDSSGGETFGLTVVVFEVTDFTDGFSPAEELPFSAASCEADGCAARLDLAVRTGAPGAALA